MSAKAQPYAGACAMCGEKGDIFRARPQGRPLSEEVKYPHQSAANTKQCCACYHKSRTPVVSSPSGGTVTQKKKRLSDQQLMKQASAGDELSPAGGTRGVLVMSPHSQKVRVFTSSASTVVIDKEASVLVREHLLCLLISMTTCGRITAKLQEGSAGLPMYLRSNIPRKQATVAEDVCPGSVVLVRTSGRIDNNNSPHRGLGLLGTPL